MNTKAFLITGAMALGTAAPVIAEEMSGNLWLQVQSTTGSTFASESGVAHQLWHRHGLVTDDDRQFVAL